MKGVIALAVKELITEKFGKDAWQKVLQGAGVAKEPLIMGISDVDDPLILQIIESISKNLGLTPAQVLEAFGDYWVGTYALKSYKPYFLRAKNAKEFLLNMDNVHVAMTKNMPNAKPPRFDYQWKDEKTLVMKYNSPRGLVDLLPGLVKGVANYYKEKLTVGKIGNSVEIKFAY